MTEFPRNRAPAQPIWPSWDDRTRLGVIGWPGLPTPGESLSGPPEPGELDALRADRERAALQFAAQLAAARAKGGDEGAVCAALIRVMQLAQQWMAGEDLPADAFEAAVALSDAIQAEMWGER